MAVNPSNNSNFKQLVLKGVNDATTVILEKYQTNKAGWKHVDKPFFSDRNQDTLQAIR